MPFYVVLSLVKEIPTLDSQKGGWSLCQEIHPQHVGKEKGQTGKYELSHWGAQKAKNFPFETVCSQKV